MVLMIPLRSSSIEAAGYDAGSRELHVRFVESGVTYVYTNVERTVFEALLQADSKGAFFQEHVRDTYSYRRLETP